MIQLKKIFLPVVFIALAVCARANTEPPNIVFILADDMGIGDLSCYG